eukprot:1310969-Ditylum_brightwellii.AAC.3
MDEGGFLAHCDEFASIIVDEFFSITLKTTGGYVLWIHEISEGANETLKNGMQAVIFDDTKYIIYWYYAHTDMAKKYNCTIHSATNDYPEYAWSGTHPYLHHIIPWGCVIYPHTHHPKALENKHVEACSDKCRTHLRSDPPMLGALAIGGTPLASSDLCLFQSKVVQWE